MGSPLKRNLRRTSFVLRWEGGGGGRSFRRIEEWQWLFTEFLPSFPSSPESDFIESEPILPSFTGFYRVLPSLPSFSSCHQSCIPFLRNLIGRFLVLMALLIFTYFFCINTYI